MKRGVKTPATTKCDTILSDFKKLFSFEYFESNAKTILLNCFLLNTRFLVFKLKCSNTKPAYESFLSSIKILKSSKFIIANTCSVLWDNIIRNGYVHSSSSRCFVLILLSLFTNLRRL